VLLFGLGLWERKSGFLFISHKSGSDQIQIYLDFFRIFNTTPQAGWKRFFIPNLSKIPLNEGFCIPLVSISASYSPVGT
jgi:hypothetical protein